MDDLVYVYNINPKTTVQSFRSFLTQQNIRFKHAYIKYYHNGQSKGYGFIHCNGPKEQDEIIKTLNGKEFEGNTLKARMGEIKPFHSTKKYE